MNVPEIALITKFVEINIISKNAVFLIKKVYICDSKNKRDIINRNILDKLYAIKRDMLRSMNEIRIAVEGFIFPEARGLFFFSGWLLSFLISFRSFIM